MSMRSIQRTLLRSVSIYIFSYLTQWCFNVILVLQRSVPVWRCVSVLSVFHLEPSASAVVANGRQKEWRVGHGDSATSLQFRLDLAEEVGSGRNPTQVPARDRDAMHARMHGCVRGAVLSTDCDCGLFYLVPGQRS